MTFPTDQRRIANIHDATYQSFVYPDGVSLGDSILQLDSDRALSEGEVALEAMR